MAYGSKAFREPHGQDRALIPESSTKVRVRIGWLALLGGLMVFSILLSIWYWVATDASIDGRRLSIATVERGVFERDIVSDAIVIAPSQRKCTAAWKGVVHLHVQAGDTVTSGESLAKIESPDLQSKILEARARSEALASEVQRNEVESEKERIVNQESIDAAELDMQAAERELDRKRQAFEHGAYAELDVRRAEDELKKAQRRLSLAQASAELDRARRALEYKRLRLEHHQQQLVVNELERQAALLDVRSPVAGQVAQVFARDNAAIEQGEPVLSVVDLSRLELEMKVPQSLAGNIVVGSLAEVTVAQERYPARVIGISPEVVEGEIATRLQFSGATPRGLRQGQRVSACIVLERRDNVVLVRRGPFLEESGGAYVYVVNGDRAVRRNIEIGAVNLSSVEVKAGLEPGEKVIISGGAEIGNALEVRIN